MIFIHVRLSYSRRSRISLCFSCHANLWWSLPRWSNASQRRRLAAGLVFEKRRARLL